MPQISTENSAILQLTKNTKTNNNIAGYHFVSRRVIFTPSDVQLAKRSDQQVAKCWVKDFDLLHEYHTRNFYQIFRHTFVN